MYVGARFVKFTAPKNSRMVLFLNKTNGKFVSLMTLQVFMGGEGRGYHRFASCLCRVS